MQPTIILQTLLMAYAAAAPMPQTSQLGSLRGSGSGFDLSKLGSFFGGGSTPSIPATGDGTAAIPSFGRNTVNDLTSGADCKSNILIFARGTTEGGNMGSVVGPSLQKSVEAAAPGKFMFQGVSYKADTAGIIAGGKPGGEIAKALIEQSVSRCPDTRIFLGGYSQGAMVVHNAVGQTTAANKAKIGGIVTFGDPFQRQPFSGVDSSKVKIFCATGDAVCEGSFAITSAHLSYNSNGNTAEGGKFIAGLAA